MGEVEPAQDSNGCCSKKSSVNFADKPPKHFCSKEKKAEEPRAFSEAALWNVPDTGWTSATETGAECPWDEQKAGAQGWDSWLAALACLQLQLFNGKHFQDDSCPRVKLMQRQRRRDKQPIQGCVLNHCLVLYRIFAILLGSSWPLLLGAFRFDQTALLKQPGVN